MSDIELLQKIADIAWLWNNEQVSTDEFTFQVSNLIPDYCWDDAYQRLSASPQAPKEQQA